MSELFPVSLLRWRHAVHSSSSGRATIMMCKRSYIGTLQAQGYKNSNKITCKCSNSFYRIWKRYALHTRRVAVVSLRLHRTHCTSTCMVERPIVFQNIPMRMKKKINVSTLLMRRAIQFIFGASMEK